MKKFLMILFFSISFFSLFLFINVSAIEIGPGNLIRTGWNSNPTVAGFGSGCNSSFGPSSNIPANCGIQRLSFQPEAGQSVLWMNTGDYIHIQFVVTAPSGSQRPAFWYPTRNSNIAVVSMNVVGDYSSSMGQDTVYEIVAVYSGPSNPYRISLGVDGGNPILSNSSASYYIVPISISAWTTQGQASYNNELNGIGSSLTSAVHGITNLENGQKNLYNQNNQILDVNKQQLESQKEHTKAVDKQTEQQKDQYDKEKQEEKNRENQGNEQSQQAQGMFNFTAFNPFSPIFALFNNGSSCVNIPIISGMINSKDKQYCPWFPANVRNILTPVLGISSMMLIFGFFIRWLNKGYV